MTPVSLRFLAAVGLVALTGLARAQPTANDPLAPLPTIRSQPAPIAPAASAPSLLREQVAALGRAFDGRAGVSVVSLNGNWRAEYNTTTLFPQQSCSKLWVAITALDAIESAALLGGGEVPTVPAATATR